MYKYANFCVSQFVFVCVGKRQKLPPFSFRFSPTCTRTNILRKNPNFFIYFVSQFLIILVDMEGGEYEAVIDRLPLDLLAHILTILTCFKDLAQASRVCQKWRQAVKESLARRRILSFSGWRMDDESTTRLVLLAYGLKDLDISRSRWGCMITDYGLYQMSNAKCIGNLSSVSLWGLAAITDKRSCSTHFKSYFTATPKYWWYVYY